MKTYLVTGGCGFIGSHLADALLAAGHAVRILDDLSSGDVGNRAPAAELIVGDVRDQQVVDQAVAGVDGCFHLAAVASIERAASNWLGTHRINLGGTIAVFDALRRAFGGRPPPMVYASSAAVYGDTPSVPQSESTRPEPRTAYGADKLGCELQARVAASAYCIPSIGLRFFNVYGPRQNARSPYSGVISLFSARVLRGDTITIHGDGQQARDFVYVSDVVEALQAAMARCKGGAGVFNVCTGHSTSILDLAHQLAALTGTSAKIAFRPPRVADVRRSLGDPEAASRALGFRARVQLPEGLASLLGTRRSRPAAVTAPVEAEVAAALTAEPPARLEVD